MATATKTASETPTPPGSPTAAASGARKIVQGGSHWKRIYLFDRAYAREMLLPMSIGLLVLVLVLAGNFVYWAINSVVNRNMNVLAVLKLFLLATPGFAVQGIPVGVILAVCLVLNRAVRDNEIVALRVAGTSVPRILAPFLVMALLAAVADWWIVEKVAPKTNDMANQTLMHLMARSAAPLIDNDKYFRVGNYYFYVQYVDGNKVLHNVMVYQRGTGAFGAFTPQIYPVVYIAASASEDPRVQNQWILRGVAQHAYNDDGTQRAESVSDTVTINVGRELSTYWAEAKEPFAMNSSELMRKIQDLSQAAFDQNKLQEWWVDYYRRVALPFACFVLALLAAPLSLRFARQGSFAGLVLAFGLAFLWQGFDGWFRALGIAGRMAPLTAAWATNALFIVAGTILLWRER